MAAQLLSVIIPTYNRRALIDVQLRALADQDYTGDFEVIVADNGSTDGLRDHIDNHELHDRLTLRYVDASGIQGPAHARNIGAEHAKADILLFCDSDDRVHENWMRRMVETLNEGYDVLGSKTEHDTLNPQRRRVLIAATAPEPQSVYGLCVAGCSLAVRADVYRDLGGMNTAFVANEDIEFGWRAQRAGYQVATVDESLVAYRFRDGFASGYRQGLQRGDGLARLHADYPGNGAPEINVLRVAYWLCTLAFAWRLPKEEWGMLVGLGIGQLRAGRRYGQLHWLPRRG